jgi:RNA polymerase sigma-70 factor, ECF subfamily
MSSANSPNLNLTLTLDPSHGSVKQLPLAYLHPFLDNIGAFHGGGSACYVLPEWTVVTHGRISRMAVALEAALIEQLRRQEEDAFTLIYERHKTQIYNYLYRLSGSSELADDLTHDTFLSAYESLPRLRPDSTIAPWLYRIASNRFRDFLRRKKVVSWLRWPDSPKFEASLCCSGGEELLPERETVQAALRAMKPEYSICLVLRLAEGFSSDETAVILGITPEAVRMRLSRARLMFKASYAVVNAGGGT